MERRSGIDGRRQRRARSFIAATVPERNETPIAAIDPIVAKATRAREEKRERKRDVCVSILDGDTRPRCEYVTVCTQMKSTVCASFPSVSATSERGREITGTRDRRIG